MKISSSIRILLFAALLLNPLTAAAINIVAGDIDHFTLITSDTVVAGEPFTVRFIAEDRFGNPIRDYDAIGSDVQVQVVGSGQITPTVLPAAAFSAGEASEEFIYDTAETFTIVVSAKLGESLVPKVVAGRAVKAIGKDRPAVEETTLAPSSFSIQKESSADKQLEEERFNVEQRLLKLSQAVEEKEKENLQLKATVSAGMLEKANLKGQLDRYKALLTEAENRLSQQQEKINHYENKQDKLAESNGSLEHKVDELTRAKASLEEENTKLTRSLHDKEQQNQDLQRELSQAALEKQRLENQFADTKGFLAHTQAKLDQLRRAESVAMEDIVKGEKDKYRVKVYKVSGEYIVLPLGKNDGLDCGMVFTLYRDEQAVAEIIIAELYDNMSMANIKRTLALEGVKEGDMVRLK